MALPHRVHVAAALALAACGVSPPPEAPPAAGPPAAPAPSAAPPEGPCQALGKSLGTLRTLAALVGLARSMPVRPVDLDRFVGELEADAARARAVQGGDPALAKLGADVAARLAKIAAAGRALAAAKRDADAEAARVTLIDEMERGEIFVGVGDERCGQGESLAGRIPASALQRVVRAGFDGFKKCYEAGLRREPALRGTVRVRFVVARDGSVSEAADADRGPPDPLAWGTGAAGKPLGDAEVSACVVAAFRRLSFPKPAGGSFPATYPIELTSGPRP
jgi:hypothetical protein